MKTSCYIVSFLKAYTDPAAGYLHSQPVYPGHQQGLVVQQGGTVTTIVTSQTQVTHTDPIRSMKKLSDSTQTRLFYLDYNFYYYFIIK